MGIQRRKLWGWAAVVLSAVLLGVIAGVGLVFWAQGQQHVWPADAGPPPPGWRDVLWPEVLWGEIVRQYRTIYWDARLVFFMVFAIGSWFAHVVAVLGIYFLPSLIVGVRQVRAVPISQARGFLIRLVVGVWREGSTAPSWRTVFLINLFLGWTVIGWFVALLMAFAREDRATQPRE